MLEVDVILSSDQSTPICAHPPDTTSDITLLELVDTLWGITSENSRIKHRKGIKLDFKTSSALAIASALLAYYMNPNESSDKTSKWPPFILNADILEGPGFELSTTKSKPLPIDWNQVLDASKRLPFADLSLGWTNFVPPPKITGGTFNKKRSVNISQIEDIHYTNEMIKEMAKICDKFESPTITIVLRACYIVNRKEKLDQWWKDVVLAQFHGQKPKVVDEDGDIVRRTDKISDNANCEFCNYNKRKNRFNFLLYSNARDEIDAEELQLFVLNQSFKGREVKKRLEMETIKYCKNCNSVATKTIESRCMLYLDLHANHVGQLDSWELATCEGLNSETMPSLLMETAAENLPKGKRFRYT